jgi:predicted dithiol-disulfide oxidoreductase (DUF899 family)
VAAQRRALPLGGEVPRDYELASKAAPVGLSRLFGDKDTMLAYSMMFGPQRKTPCPKPPRTDYRKQRGLTNLSLVSDPSGDYTRAYVSPEDADVPGFTVSREGTEAFVTFVAPKWALRWLTPDKTPAELPTPIHLG